jgi:hypothetical protein
MNTYAIVAARPQEGSQGIDPTGDGIDPITTKLIHLWKTKGATCQLEGDCVDVAGGGTDRSTLTLVKPGAMKGEARRQEGAHGVDPVGDGVDLTAPTLIQPRETERESGA